MKKNNMIKNIILFLLLIQSVNFANETKLSTIGPSFHLNFSKNKFTYSFGLEYSYWILPYGIDAGIEINNKLNILLYTEIQFGLLAGISTGPFIEINKSKSLNYGHQTSIWIGFHDWDMYGGIFDLRLRYGTNPIQYSGGIFGKIAKCTGSCEL